MRVPNLIKEAVNLFIVDLNLFNETLNLFKHSRNLFNLPPRRSGSPHYCSNIEFLLFDYDYCNDYPAFKKVSRIFP
ncbi:hypothetical protein [Alteribacter keqinensis]|uniref:Uncharacterized protein n=1 Tax=Alteribacter keqinensis TaxID=2483800 RepID=A0A3M7TVM3_9BACI|nr:hypothetical protein [Alteribacter keqinensis]RNA69637.1 hypothetical protein EBO34_06785 [Alteribacter keqinensis]